MANSATLDAVLHAEPTIVTSSTNRNVLQPTKINRQRRRSRIREIQDDNNHHSKGKSRSRSAQRKPLLGRIASESGSDASSDSGNSQLRDLVVEDHEAEEIERARARKEGSARWNEAEPKHFV